MRKFGQALGCLAVVAGIGLVEPVGAAVSTSNLDVTITITNQCTAGATTPVNFGSRGVLNANFDATGTVAVTCTNGATYAVGIGAGGGVGATLAVRKMTGPASATVNYQLYRDSGRSLNWGDIASGDTLSGTGSGIEQVIDVFGRVGSQATPAAGTYGTYNDIVLVTFSY